MQSPSVNSPQNKELLWDTLQESGAFAGLMQSQFQPVQSAFDRTVNAAALSSSSMSLNDANKRIIRDFVQVLQQLRQSGQSGQSKPAHQPAQQPAQSIELVYRAKDLQNERVSEFDRNLREKKAEMDAFLTLKKPTDVNFSDTSKGVLDDKPIGDEMSRLIAQELAARERELVQLKPEDIKRAQQWLGATATTTATPTTATARAQNVVIKKSVSFSEEDYEMDQMDQMEQMEQMDQMDQENFEEMDIFSKFKKLSAETIEAEAETTETIESIEAEATEAETIETINVDSSMQQIYAKLLELEERMNANHAEIMARLNH